MRGFRIFGVSMERKMNLPFANTSPAADESPLFQYKTVTKFLSQILTLLEIVIFFIIYIFIILFVVVGVNKTRYNNQGQVNKI